jgi:GNAT superfamily N-acetyltransferase
MATDASRYEAAVRLRDGAEVTIRAIRPEDKEILHEHFLSLGRESVYNRFFGPKRDLSDAELRRLTDLDFDTHVGLFAARRHEGREEVLGVARYVVIQGSSPRRAEMAVAVSDACQGLGVGTLLLDHLARIAVSRGVQAFEADVLGANGRMLRMIRRSGLPLDLTRNGGVLHVFLRVPDHAGGLASELGTPAGKEGVG